MQLVVQYVTQASIKQCFRVPVITRAAAFNTRCNLSVTVCCTGQDNVTVIDLPSTPSCACSYAVAWFFPDGVSMRLHTSGFVDDVMLPIVGQAEATEVGRLLEVTCQRAARNRGRSLMPTIASFTCILFAVKTKRR